MYLLTAKQKTTFAHQSNNLFLKRPKTDSFRLKVCLDCELNWDSNHARSRIVRH